MQRSFGALSLVVLEFALTAACGASKKAPPESGDANAGTRSTAASGGNGGSGGSIASSEAGSGGGGGSSGARGGATAAGFGGGANHGAGGKLVGAGGFATSSGGAGGESGGATADAGRGPGGTAGTSSGGHANGGAAGQTSAPTLEGCATWALETAHAATSTIALTDGGVLLFRPGGASNTQTLYNTADVALSQPGLSGDFDIVVRYDNFQPGDATPFQGPEFQAGAIRRDPTGYIYQVSGSVGAGDGDMAILVPNDDTPITAFSPIPDPAALVGASGAIEVARKDGIMTSSVTINGVKNSISSTTPYNEDGFVFFVSIGLRGESQGPADASVRITSVEVEGGGGAVMSDSFDCGH